MQIFSSGRWRHVGRIAHDCCVAKTQSSAHVTVPTGCPAAQPMVEKAMSVMPDDPMASAFAMALLLPLHQTPMEPKEIAVGSPDMNSLFLRMSGATRVQVGSSGPESVLVQGARHTEESRFCSRARSGPLGYIVLVAADGLSVVVFEPSAGHGVLPRQRLGEEHHRRQYPRRPGADILNGCQPNAEMIQ